MLKGKRVLAVVPARGGSKGLPGKNLKPVGGVPLVALAGQVAAGLDFIDRAVVSTDDDEIARVAEAQGGLDAPFRRPEGLSGDRIADLDVLIHATQFCEAQDGVEYDVIVMLHPTSPLRRAEDVEACARLLVEEALDAVWTVSETDSKAHPRKQLEVAQDGSLTYYHPEGAQVIARQQLTPVYHRNGVAYAFSRDCLLERQTIMGPKTKALVIPGEHVSIDTQWDLELVEYILSRQADPEG